MTDPSAGRPSTPPKKPFTEKDVETLSDALADFYGGSWRDEAGFVLRHLAAAGRLLPASSEHRDPPPKRLVGTCPVCSEPITGFAGEPLMEIWDRGYLEYLACAYRFEPCGHEQVKDLRPVAEVDGSPTDEH